MLFHYNSFYPFKFSGVAVILGLVRGELKKLWNYSPESSSMTNPLGEA